jgi:hypothetical protein
MGQLLYHLALQQVCLHTCALQDCLPLLLLLLLGAAFGKPWLV